MTAAFDQDVALGMLLLTVGVAPIINSMAETTVGKLGLWALYLSMYYLIAANMVLTKMGHPLFE